jgi:hypothetical protein
MKKLVVWDHVSDQISELVLGTEFRNTTRVVASLENTCQILFILKFSIYFTIICSSQELSKSISILNVYWLVEVVLEHKTYNVLWYCTKYKSSLF